MTAIAVYSDGNTAALGIDSASQDGSLFMVNDSKRPRVHDIVSPKGKPRGRLVVASCGRHRITNEIVNRWDPPTRRKADGTPSYMLDVGASLQAHLAEPDSPPQRFVRERDDNSLDGWMLAICDGRVFAIGSDFSVFEPSNGYMGGGSAAEVVTGALAALHGTGLTPSAIVQRALEIATSHVQGIAGPFHIEACSA